MKVGVPAGELWVDEYGSGPPLVLVQGLGNSGWPTARIAPGFEDRWRVIGFDNRGTGRSFKSPPPGSIADLADDAAALLKALGIESAHVLGHSMGGYVVQTLALRQPDLVRSLVLVSTGAGAPTHEDVPPATLELWLSNQHLPPDEYAQKTMHISFADGWLEARPEERKRLMAERLEYPTPQDAWRAQYEACLRFVATGLPIEEIQAPVFVLHGDGDRVIPISNGRAIADRIPGAELTVLDGVGHYPYVEDPERFTARVRGFLERVEKA